MHESDSQKKIKVKDSKKIQNAQVTANDKLNNLPPMKLKFQKEELMPKNLIAHNFFPSISNNSISKNKEEVSRAYLKYSIQKNFDNYEIINKRKPSLLKMNYVITEYSKNEETQTDPEDLLLAEKKWNNYIKMKESLNKNNPNYSKRNKKLENGLVKTQDESKSKDPNINVRGSFQELTKFENINNLSNIKKIRNNNNSIPFIMMIKKG